MQVSVSTLEAITGKADAKGNMRSTVQALQKSGARAGLNQPHRLAHYLAQLLHESAGFVYDKEIWGPTPAQQRYEGREDLGNTQPGDGKKFMGRTPGQITGRRNYQAFYDWCKAQGYNPPDFVANPDLLNTDPWEGMGFIWYWDVGNPTRKSLNAFADANDIEMVTRRVNGGLNGFDDRVSWYVKAALVLLGYGPRDVAGFQRWAQANGLLPADAPGKSSQVDGIPGPKTRGALHKALGDMSGRHVKAAPVVEVETVAPPQIDKPITQTTGFWERVTSIGGLSGIAGFAAFFQDWKVIAAVAICLIFVSIAGLLLHKQIIDAVKTAKQELN